MAWLVGSRYTDLCLCPSILGRLVSHGCHPWLFLLLAHSQPSPYHCPPLQDQDGRQMSWNRDGVDRWVTGVYRGGPPILSPPELLPSFPSPVSLSQLPILFCLSLPPQLTTLFLSPFWSSFAVGELRTKAVGVKGTKHARKPQMCQY